VVACLGLAQGPMADVHHVAVGPAADCATVTLRFALPGPNRNRSGVIGPLQRRVLGGASRQPFARGDWTVGALHRVSVASAETAL